MSNPIRFGSPPSDADGASEQPGATGDPSAQTADESGQPNDGGADEAAPPTGEIDSLDGEPALSDESAIPSPEPETEGATGFSFAFSAVSSFDADNRSALELTVLVQANAPQTLPLALSVDSIGNLAYFAGGEPQYHCDLHIDIPLSFQDGAASGAATLNLGAYLDLLPEGYADSVYFSYHLMPSNKDAGEVRGYALLISALEGVDEAKPAMPAPFVAGDVTQIVTTDTPAQASYTLAGWDGTIGWPTVDIEFYDSLGALSQTVTTTPTANDVCAFGLPEDLPAGEYQVLSAAVPGDEVNPPMEAAQLGVLTVGEPAEPELQGNIHVAAREGGDERLTASFALADWNPIEPYPETIDVMVGDAKETATTNDGETYTFQLPSNLESSGSTAYKIVSMPVASEDYVLNAPIPRTALGEFVIMAVGQPYFVPTYELETTGFAASTFYFDLILQDWNTGAPYPDKAQVVTNIVTSSGTVAVTPYATGTIGGKHVYRTYVPPTLPVGGPYPMYLAQAIPEDTSGLNPGGIPAGMYLGTITILSTPSILPNIEGPNLVVLTDGYTDGGAVTIHVSGWQDDPNYASRISIKTDQTSTTSIPFKKNGTYYWEIPRGLKSNHTDSVVTVAGHYPILASLSFSTIGKLNNNPGNVTGKNIGWIIVLPKGKPAIGGSNEIRLTTGYTAAIEGCFTLAGYNATGGVQTVNVRIDGGTPIPVQVSDNGTCKFPIPAGLTPKGSAYNISVDAITGINGNSDIAAANIGIITVKNQPTLSGSGDTTKVQGYTAFASNYTLANWNAGSGAGARVQMSVGTTPVAVPSAPSDGSYPFTVPAGLIAERGPYYMTATVDEDAYNWPTYATQLGRLLLRMPPRLSGDNSITLQTGYPYAQYGTFALHDWLDPLFIGTSVKVMVGAKEVPLHVGVTNGVHTFEIPAGLAAGTYPITASATGDANNDPIAQTGIGTLTVVAPTGPNITGANAIALSERYTQAAVGRFALAGFTGTPPAFTVTVGGQTVPAVADDDNSFSFTLPMGLTSAGSPYSIAVNAAAPFAETQVGTVAVKSRPIISGNEQLTPAEGYIENYSIRYALSGWQNDAGIGAGIRIKVGGLTLPIQHGKTNGEHFAVLPTGLCVSATPYPIYASVDGDAFNEPVEWTAIGAVTVKSKPTIQVGLPSLVVDQYTAGEVFFFLDNWQASDGAADIRVTIKDNTGVLYYDDTLTGATNGRVAVPYPDTLAGYESQYYPDTVVTYYIAVEILGNSMNSTVGPTVICSLYVRFNPLKESFRRTDWVFLPEGYGVGNKLRFTLVKWSTAAPMPASAQVTLFGVDYTANRVSIAADGTSAEYELEIPIGLRAKGDEYILNTVAIPAAAPAPAIASANIGSIYVKRQPVLAGPNDIQLIEGYEAGFMGSYALSNWLETETYGTLVRIRVGGISLPAQRRKGDGTFRFSIPSELPVGEYDIIASCSDDYYNFPVRSQNIGKVTVSPRDDPTLTGAISDTLESGYAAKTYTFVLDDWNVSDDYPAQIDVFTAKGWVLGHATRTAGTHTYAFSFPAGMTDGEYVLYAGGAKGDKHNNNVARAKIGSITVAKPSFALTYHPNNDTPDITAQLNPGVVVPQLAPTPTKMGHSIVGWYTNAGFTGAMWVFGTGVMPSANLDLYCKWQPLSFKLTFDTQGGSAVAPNPVTVTYGTPLTAPEEPTKQGYVFAGWYADAACTTPWNFQTGTMPAQDMTLYAKWDQSPLVTIEYRAETGGNVSRSSETLDRTLGKPSGSHATPDTGYVFSNWTLGGAVVSTDPLFVPSVGTDGQYHAATYVAHFIKKATLELIAGSLHVVYDARPHTVNSYTSKGLVSGDEVRGVSVARTATNAGTYATEVEGTPRVDRNGVDVTAQYDVLTRKGKLVIDKRTIKIKIPDYSKPEGTADPTFEATVTGLLGDDTIDYTLRREPGEKPGRYAISAVVGSSNPNYHVVVDKGSLTITGGIRYDANGGQGSVPVDSTHYAPGDVIKISFSPVPEKPGASFVGWSENPDAAVPTYAPGGVTSIVMRGTGITLYAVYSTLPIATGRVEYYYDDVMDPTASVTLINLTIGSTVRNYPDRIRPGYAFSRAANCPMLVSEDARKNVIRVYYTQMEVAVTIIDVPIPMSVGANSLNVGECIE